MMLALFFFGIIKLFEGLSILLGADLIKVCLTPGWATPRVHTIYVWEV